MRLTPTRIAAVATAGLMTAAPSLAQQPQDGGRYSVAKNVHQRGARVEIPAGTAIPVILDQEIPVERGRLGDLFHAHVKRDVVVDGKVVIPSGAPAKVKLVESSDTPNAATLRRSGLRVDGEMRKVTAGDARADTDASDLAWGLLSERGREIDDGTSLRFELERDLETR